jgi:glutathione peroxidase
LTSANPHQEEGFMVYRSVAAVLALCLLFGSCGAASKTAPESKSEASVITEGAKMAQTDIAKIRFETMAGDTTSLADYRGKVLLIVNVASECGYTPQYADLEALYRRFKDSGLVVIGFPANNFGGQEPGTNEQILNFCQSKFHVTFPMMAKVSVKESDKHPLFAGLTEASPIPGEIEWNFAKFLIGREGNLVARYPSKVEPMSDEIVGKIEELL